MKHLKPYNKIYSMMCGVVVFPCVSVYSCNSCFASCGIIVCYRYVFKRCLKICSHIYHVFRSFFFHAFFCLFLFQTDTFFSTSKELVYVPLDREIRYGSWFLALTRASPETSLRSARGISSTHTFPLVRVTLFFISHSDLYNIDIGIQS